MGTRTDAVPAMPYTRAQRVAWTTVRVSWRLVSFPVLALLIILEPLVRVLCAGLALLLTLSAFFWRFAAPPGLHVPFFGMLALAVGCIAVLTAYYWLLRVLSI
jgi:hypothetical protein